MSNVRTGQANSANSLLQQLREDTNAEYVDQLISQLAQYMEEIEVAQLNCEDANAARALGSLHRSAFVSGEGLRDAWSRLHLRKQA